MDMVSLGWVAGFLEGEGYFSGRGKSRTCPGISAAQVQREPLDRMVKVCGGKVNGPYGGKQKNHTPAYRWDLGGTPAVALMMTLFGLMSPKRKEAIRATLAVWRAAPGNPATWRARGVCQNGHPMAGENYIVAPSGHGRCRACGIAGRRRYYVQHKDKWREYARRNRAKLHLSLGPTALGG